VPTICGSPVKRWLARQDPAATAGELQAQLDRFTDYYRPHRPVGRKPPITAYTARPKAVPTPPAPAPDTPARHFRVRVDRIDDTGVVTLRHHSRLHHIGIGRGHAGTRVTLLVADLHIRIITDDGHLLRELTLDPSRDCQPQRRPTPPAQPHPLNPDQPCPFPDRCPSCEPVAGSRVAERPRQRRRRRP
jgi:hypothetical protein